MNNKYYNEPATPVDYTKARADAIRAQFASISGGFEKLPDPEDLTENRIGFVEAAGTANVLTVELPTAPASYENGMTLKVGITTTNTGPATMNVNSLGAVQIVGRAKNPLQAGDLVAETVETMTYYAGRFIIREVAGAQGPQGPIGLSYGPEGKSAYEVAVEQGFVGNEAAWLASLIGPAGQSAYQVAVAEGYAGNVSQWLASLVGKSAYQSAVDDGFSGTESEWVASMVGVDGTNGQSAYQIAVTNGFGGTESEWLASLVGPSGAGTEWADLGSKPALVTALAALTGANGSIMQFTSATGLQVVSMATLIAGLSSGDKTAVADALGAVNVVSKSLSSPGYIKLNVGGENFMIQWGSQNISPNTTTVVSYPQAFSNFSIAVISSAQTATNAQDNNPGVISCGKTSFSVFSALGSTRPGFWIAVGK